MESIISRMLANFKLAGSVYLLKFFWTILLFLLVISSFFLGRLTKFMETRPVFSFESREVEEAVYNKQKDELFGKVSTSTIVASSGGKKYYFVWCRGAANIKESKKRYFATEESAQKAGYTLANNCK